MLFPSDQSLLQLTSERFSLLSLLIFGAEGRLLCEFQLAYALIELSPVLFGSVAIYLGEIGVVIVNREIFLLLILWKHLWLGQFLIYLYTWNRLFSWSMLWCIFGGIKILHTILVFFSHLPSLPEASFLFILVIFELFAEVFLMLFTFLNDFADMLFFVLAVPLLAITQLLFLTLCPIDKVLFHCFDTTLLLLLSLELLSHPLLLFYMIAELLSTKWFKWFLIESS